MRVIITAGGTGGHIYPALAVIDKIRQAEPDSEILYIGTHNRMEKDIVPAQNINYMALKMYGLSTDLVDMPRNVINVYLIQKAYHECLKKIQEFKPDVVLGFGGYVTYPVIKAAHKLGVKTFIHEQNSVPGKANKSLLKYVDLVGVSFKDSLKYFAGHNAIMTGNPCGEKALRSKKISKTTYGLSPTKKSVLFVNGSLGSEAMNAKMQDFLHNCDNDKYEVLYITGKNYYEVLAHEQLASNVKIVPYIDNLSSLMKDVDLIVGRAGASSLAEITSLGLPCILIPSPYVANNHQYYNALSIAEKDAGIMIQEKDLTTESLQNSIAKILFDDEYRMKMRHNLQKMAMNDSATIIYNEIKDLIK